MMELDWTELALNDYDDCIKYVEEKFSEKRAMKFVNEMDYNLKLIATNPNTFPKSDYKDIRYVVVMKPITLFYKIKNENTVQIVRIWNNRKDKSADKIER